MAKVWQRDRAVRVPRRVAAGAASILGLFLLHAIPTASSATEVLPGEESQACQECHGISDWEINDPVGGRVAQLSIDTEAYGRSAHGSVPCRTCHDWGYDQIPHRGSSEHPIYECVFCHDEDPAVQHLRLSARKEDVRGSVHADTEFGPMDCHSCHDPHVFQLVNDASDPLKRIDRSNAICLECHGPDADPRRRYARQDTAPSHLAFPNYSNHLRKVKCVVCHTARDDPNATRHGIMEKGRSLAECEQCHSPNSPILDAIYAPVRPGEQARRTRLSGVEVEGVGNVYVIGSTRSPRLERLSVIAFAVIGVAIALHGLARAIYAIRTRGAKGE